MSPWASDGAKGSNITGEKKEESRKRGKKEREREREKKKKGEIWSSNFMW